MYYESSPVKFVLANIPKVHWILFTCFHAQKLFRSFLYGKLRSRPAVERGDWNVLLLSYGDGLNKRPDDTLIPLSLEDGRSYSSCSVNFGFGDGWSARCTGLSALLFGCEFKASASFELCALPVLLSAGNGAGLFVWFGAGLTFGLFTFFLSGGSAQTRNAVCFDAHMFQTDLRRYLTRTYRLGNRKWTILIMFRICAGNKTDQTHPFW